MVGPAYGGSTDAYLDGVTGFTPRDESEEALRQVLSEILADPDRLTGMGERAAAWARRAFAPDRYATQVVDRLL